MSLINRLSDAGRRFTANADQSDLCLIMSQNDARDKFTRSRDSLVGYRKIEQDIQVGKFLFLFSDFL